MKSYGLMLPLILLVLGLFLVSIATFSVHAGPAAREPNPQLTARVERLCGPRSVVQAAARLGISLDLDALAARCKTGPEGTSLLNLRDAAVDSMLFAQGVHLSWAQLVALDTPAVLYLAPRHFVMVDPREKLSSALGDAVHLYDFPKAARWVSRQELEASWHGETLILRDLIPRPKQLQFETLLDDFGPVPGQGTVCRTVHFRNTGPDPVQIKGIESSCGCTVGKLDKTTLQPGETGELSVTVKLSGRRGVQRQVIKLWTDERANPQVKLTFQGIVVKPIHLSRDLIDLGQVFPGQAVTQSLIVTDRGGGDLQLKSFTLARKGEAQEAPALDASWAPVANSADTAPASANPERYRIMDRGAGDQHFMVQFTVHIPAPAKPGPALAELVLDTTDQFFPQVKLPLLYYVNPAPLAAAPARLNLGVADLPRAARQAVAVQSLDGSPLLPPDLSFEFQGQRVDAALGIHVSRPSETSAILEMTPNWEKIKPLLQPGLNHGVLHLTSGVRQVSIPWSCLISQ